MSARFLGPISALVWGLHSSLSPPDWNGMLMLPEDEIAGSLGVQGEPSDTAHHPCDLEPPGSLTGPQAAPL